VGFFNKNKKNNSKTINYHFARALIAATIVTLGEDRFKDDNELNDIREAVADFLIPEKEYNAILEEFKIYLQSKENKMKLLSSIEPALTSEERSLVFRHCCRTALHDDRVLITEMALLEEIAVMLNLDFDLVNRVIEEEQRARNIDL
jgi:hypothetical protein